MEKQKGYDIAYIADYLGLDHWLNQTMERCARLIVACNKIKRYKDKESKERLQSRIDNLIERAGDVKVCLLCLSHLMSSRGFIEGSSQKFRMEASISANKKIHREIERFERRMASVDKVLDERF